MEVLAGEMGNPIFEVHSVHVEVNDVSGDSGVISSISAAVVGSLVHLCSSVAFSTFGTTEFFFVRCIVKL